ncbi:MAG TPA: division/cell wall cluster transcriptional repressor MraZ [Terriglobia bacterium]|nr:division/cell wall cluster transcriptional repressor MraZ [Terriglobia bacterium]
MLYGRYPATVDVKGRLKFPAAVRPDLDQAYGPDFFVTSVDKGQSVRVYPLPVWKAIAEKLMQPPSFNTAKQRLLEQINYWGQVVRIDGQGRILIPSLLRDPAAMRGEVAVLGKLNHIDVWNGERLREHIESGPLTDEDREKLDSMGI